MRTKYKHLFFDIDRTMWDYEANLKEVLNDLVLKYKLGASGITVRSFYTTFNKHNEQLWRLYREGEIGREFLRYERFKRTLEELGLNNEKVTRQIAEDYLVITPTKTQIFPDATDTLLYLKKKYALHVITNGFNEVQFKKLINSGLDIFFTSIVTSDSAGYRKPDKRIFAHALSSVNAKKTQSLMIGDDWEADIMGAKKFGIDQVFYNPKQIAVAGAPTYEIMKLAELKAIL
jgi:putative hydrolase of the HAD superfamily